MFWKSFEKENQDGGCTRESRLMKEILLELEDEGRKITFKDEQRKAVTRTTVWKERLGSSFTKGFRKESHLPVTGVIEGFTVAEVILVVGQTRQNLQ